MGQVTITCSALTPTTVEIRCSSVTYALKKNNSVFPLENGTDVAEVNTQSFENPKLTINGVHITGEANTFTMSHALTLMALKDTETYPVTLTVTYGRDGISSTLPKWTTGGIVTTSMPVVLESANFSIDARDSKEGYMPTGTLNFIQTRE